MVPMSLWSLCPEGRFSCDVVQIQLFEENVTCNSFPLKDAFWHICSRRLLKLKKKLVIMSNFTFCQNILKTIFIDYACIRCCCLFFESRLLQICEKRVKSGRWTLTLEAFLAHKFTIIATVYICPLVVIANKNIERRATDIIIRVAASPVINCIKESI